MRNGQMVEQDVASKYSLTSTICRPAASATARTRDVLPLPGAPVTKKEDWIAKELAIGVVISRSRVRSRSACLSSNGAGGDADRTPTKSAVGFKLKKESRTYAPVSLVSSQGHSMPHTLRQQFHSFWIHPATKLASSSFR
jgi:hypothetical protein